MEQMEGGAQQAYVAMLLPNWQAAGRHAKAANIGKKSTQNPSLKDYCECCNSSVQKEPIRLGQHVKELNFLGFGVPLFYLFLQCCIILNLLLIVTDSIYIISKSAINSAARCQNYHKMAQASLKPGHGPTHMTVEGPSHMTVEGPSHMSVDGPSHMTVEGPSHMIGEGLLRRSVRNSSFKDIDESQRIKCTSWFVYYAYTEQQLSLYEQVIRCCSIAIHFCCLLFIKSKMIKRSQYYDEIYHGISDYCAIFKELSSQTLGKLTKAKQLITELQRETKSTFGTQEIIVLPQNELLERNLVKSQSLLSAFLQARESGDPAHKSLYKELVQIQGNIVKQSKNCRQQLQKDQIKSKNVIIVFQKEQSKLSFLEEQERIRKLQSFAKLGGSAQTRIEACPDPKQIVWTNLKYAADRKRKVLFVWLLSFAFFVITAVGFYHLQTYKNQSIREALLTAQEDSERGAELRSRIQLIGWSTWLGIIIYNKLVMSKVLQYLTKFEKHDNIANQDFSFAFKYALGMFFTSSIMKLVVEAVQNQNYYRHDFGIIQDESKMFVFSALCLPLIWAIYPQQLLHLAKRAYYKDKENVTQAQANYLAADYPYRIGKRYAQIIEMMWFTFLYVDLIPMGSVFIFLGQCLYYWIDKYNLLRRSSFNYTLSGSLSNKILPLLDLTLVWRFLGAFVFDIQLRGHVYTATICLLVLSLLFIVMPWPTIFEYFDHEEFLLNDELYGKFSSKLFENVNYKAMNPIYNFVYNKRLLQRRTHFLGS